MPLYRDEAVVLRVHKLGEADRIVTLLTKRHGRVRAVGKGVRRTTSRYGARLEPGSHIDVQLYTRTAEPDAARGHLHTPGLDLITQVASVDNYGARVARDYSAWTAAVAICETAERLTPEEGEPALRQYLLVTGALRSLADREHQASLILDAFLIRSMSLAGWEPALS
ncbi:MAG TPA: DNA repair protein RecO, partial [Jatrophihabitans sp.]|nr:DNA repair protein RecO [Jatrophihabitans sp.]